jgi:DNA adenine methylase Dam
MKYINGYLNYTGSKHKLLNQLIPMMDYTKKYFADIFAGSMVVSANLIDKFDKILVNDILIDIIKIHQNVLNDNNFIEEVKKLSNVKDNKEDYNKLRDSYNNHNTPEKLFALILSCNSNLMRFNQKGEFNQTWGRRQFNSSTQEKINIFIDNVSPHKNKISFSSQHFNNIKINKPTMVYLDPPYGFIEDKYGNILNKQISEAGYNSTYKKEDDIQLYNYCKELHKNGSSFMLSGLLEHDGKKSWLLNQLIRDGFNYKELYFDYNKVSKKGKKESKEIIIINYEK